MSKINNLIKEMCPNGVVLKPIDSVVDLYYGKGITFRRMVGNILYMVLRNSKLNFNF